MPLCCSNTISLGTILATNYISLAAGASLFGAALSQAGVTLATSTVILERVGHEIASVYSASVNLRSAESFVLIGGSALTNTVREPTLQWVRDASRNRFAFV